MAPLAFALTDAAVLAGVTLLTAVGQDAPVPALLGVCGLGVMLLVQLMREGGVYRFRDRRLAVHVLRAGMFAGLAALFAALAGQALGVLDEVPVAWVLSMASVTTALHLLWGGLIRRWHRSGALSCNIVLVGATEEAARLIAAASGRRDIRILGVFDDRTVRSPTTVQDVPVLGDLNDLLRHPMAPYVDRVVVTLAQDAAARTRQITARLAVVPNEIVTLVDPDGDGGINGVLDRLAGAALAVPGDRGDDHRAFRKRVQDLTIGTIALLALAPVMMLIAAAIRIDGPGPIFFRQRRHGFNQEEIVVWKFRTMRPETADATASRQVTANDDRVTRVGRVLRATSLDELPQLFNVLAGEMALVGPRPHAIGMKTGDTESALLVTEYARRHRIKPGMTGWAAIKGSRGPMHHSEDVRRRVALDIEYIERQSIWLDLWIMAVTIPVMLGDRATIR
ncbi:exopolysaccharide biosynthesis polyprenyl glycosylphosphotransferase [Rhizobium sp. CRIBSB]|nr:exopolysaccharide biosynthesis polyprenyl glycosylphosphotransferase [Rhizobium sp. CRIBSB]